MVPVHSDMGKMKSKIANISKRHSLRCWMFDVGCSMFLWSLVVGTWNFNARAAETSTILSTWLNAQTNIQSWSADFVQTRTLKSLTQPLTATGHIWFAAPNRFRWELGNPPQ